MPVRAPGLSPRVRGNRSPDCRRRTTSRSIPACAGEPRSSMRCSAACRVYPRVCGGTLEAARSPSSERGLSPRVRGNPHVPRHGRAGRRSIPACAGEPRIGRVCCRMRGVYPRVCGGTPGDAPHRPVLGGLSPRVRGNQAHSSIGNTTLRSIPACAGEPSWAMC